MKPRLLFISPVMPAEGGNGLAMRAGLFLEALARCGKVDLVVLPAAGGPGKPTAFARRLARTAQVVTLRDRTDTHFALLQRLADPAARLQAFRDYGRPSLMRFLTAPVLGELRDRLAGETYDAVHLMRLYLAPLIQIWDGARPRRPLFSLDLDEDEVSTRESLARLHRDRGAAEAADWELAEARAYRRLEAQYLPRFDRLWMSSPLEGKRLAARMPARSHVAPNAIALPAEARGQRRKPAGAPRLLFVGSMGYLPNDDAMRWFLAAIWPRLRAHPLHPRLDIVGSHPPESLRRQDGRDGIRIVEPRRSLAPYYRRAALAIVPIRGGGGTRLKILEAGAFALPVVSTRIGAEGLSFRSPRHLWLADSADRFLAACIEALEDPAEAARRGMAARREVEARYERGRVGAALAAGFARLLPG